MHRPNPRSMRSAGEIDFDNFLAYQEDDDQDTDGYGMPLKATTKPEPRPSRLKLNINPRSLFRKRRTEPEFSPTLKSPVSNTGQFPQPSPDFDPRIRGSGIHDFNVPRKLSSGTFVAGISNQFVGQRTSGDSAHRALESPRQRSADGHNTATIVQSPLERDESLHHGSAQSARTSSIKRGPSSAGSRFSFDVVTDPELNFQERVLIDGSQRKKKNGKTPASISGSLDSRHDANGMEEEDVYDPNDISYDDDDGEIPGFGKPNISEMTLEDFDRQKRTTDGHESPPLKSDEKSLHLPHDDEDLQNYEYEQEDELYFDDGFMDGQPSPGEGSFDESIFDQVQPGEKLGLDSGDKHFEPDDLRHALSSVTSITPNSVSTVVDTSRQSSFSGTNTDHRIEHVDIQNSEVESWQDANRPESVTGLQEGFQPDQTWKSPNQFKPRSSSLSKDSTHLSSLSPEAQSCSGGVVRFDLFADEQAAAPSGYSTDLDSSVDFAAHTSAPWDDDNLDGFDGDEDDEMIALANAEALENDEDGTYGREFGFYARSSNRGQNELVDGGFYCTNGWSGVRRSHSGKTVALEPNLTPISERSEASQRNSLASMSQAHDLSLVQEVGLKLSQIALDIAAGEDHEHDPDMSFEGLARLRRSAWGQKGNSRPNSGQTEISTQPIGHETRPDTSYGATNQLSGDNNNASPALSSISTFEKPPRPAFMSHSRNSSGGGSVSYVLERDEDGVSSRWIVERRRLNENGTGETVAREVLQGGRI